MSIAQYALEMAEDIDSTVFWESVKDAERVANTKDFLLMLITFLALASLCMGRIKAL